MMKFDETNDNNFSDLPSHVLVNILLRLKLSDFKNAVQTCKSWYYASCDPQITRNILIHGLNESAQIEYMRRPIHNFRLNNVNMNKFQFRKLFTNFGETIVDLEILMSKLAFTRIFEIFAYLPNVQTLQIYLVSNYFSSQNFYKYKALQKHHNRIVKNLGQIKYLTVHSRMRDIHVMKLFLSHCTNIVKLHWNESIYLPNNQIEFICNFILEPLEYPAISNVTDLLIGCIHPNDNRQFFTKLINVPLPNLRVLYIKEISKQKYDATFQIFCKTYHYIEDFTINSCNQKHLHDICKYMHNLKSLRIDKCTAYNLEDIAQLPLLQSLQLDRIGNYKNNKLIKLLSLKLPNLTKLTFNSVDDDLLAVICENYKTLEELTLTRVSTIKCEPIFRNLVNLKILKMWFNMAPPCNSSHMDILPDGNITNLTKLEDLYVNSWVPGITPVLIQKLPKLQRMNLEEIWDPTDEEFAEEAIAIERRDARMASIQLEPELEPELGNLEYELTDFNEALYNDIL